MNEPEIKSEDDANKEIFEILEKNGYQAVTKRRKKQSALTVPFKVTQIGGIQEYQFDKIASQ